MQNANMLRLLSLGNGFGFSSTANERPRKNVKAGSDMLRLTLSWKQCGKWISKEAVISTT